MQREKNIAANKAVLASLGLLDDAAALRGSQDKTHAHKPKVKKATPQSLPNRKPSGRAEKLEKQAAEEAAKEAKRRAEEEAVLEEKREQARLARKQREAIARREAAKEAKRKAKLEEERKARARQLAELRRERDAEMRRLRQEKAEAARRMREAARRERDAACATAAEEIRQRKANLRQSTRSGVEEAVASAVTRRSQAERAAKGRASERRVSAAMAEGEEYVTVYVGMCDAPGCCLEAHHLGPCSNEVVREGQRRGAAQKVASYKDAFTSDAEFSRQFGLTAPYVPSPKKSKSSAGSSSQQRIDARSMLAAGHVYVGRRVARLFGKRLVLGTVTGWLPACKVQGEPALFRIVHDDGDEEDLEEEEAAEASEDYETLAPREARWLGGSSHPHMGARLLRTFDGGATRVLATITKWLPADAANGEPALFRIVHDDGDEEDLEEEEAADAIEAFDLTAMEKEDWRTGGHPFIGREVLRTFESDGGGGGGGGGGSKRKRTVARGTITKWLPADEANGEPPLWRCVHVDGDEEDLEEHEAKEAIEAAEALPARRSSGRIAQPQPYV